MGVAPPALVRPRPGIDYPRSLVEFGEFFADENTCVAYLERLRWPEGFVCPSCKRRGAGWRSGRGLIVCKGCQRQTSVTAGTVFEGTRKPLRHWFLAVWEVTSQKYGASALGMKRVLGLGSYETAWAWLHKLRRAMVRPGRDQLAGIVEVDESYLGGDEPGVHGRQTLSKAIIGIAVEMNGGALGRIRLRHIADVKAASLVPFVIDVVKPGSTVHTDGWSGYKSLDAKGFKHLVTVASTSPDPAHVVFPGVHRVASLLKRWCLGTHQGDRKSTRLNSSHTEFTFRFNRRTSKTRGLLFHRLLAQAAGSPHVDTDALFRSTGRGPTRSKAASHYR